MLFIRREYDDQERELHVREDLVVEGPHREQRVVIPVNGINRAVIQAVNFGRTMSRDVRAVFVTEDPEHGEAIRERWERQVPGVPAGHRRVAVPGGHLAGPRLPRRPRPGVAARTRRRRSRSSSCPNTSPRHWWERLLYNQTAKRLKAGDPRARAHRHRRRPVPPRALTASREMSRPAPGPERRGGIVAVACRTSTPHHSTGPCVALNGGPSDARIVRLVASLAAKTKAELIAVHVVEIDWTLPLDADIAGRSEDVQRVLDSAEAIAEGFKLKMEPVLLQARDVAAAIVDEATERGADLLVVGLPYRKRFGGEFAIGRTIPYILQNAPCTVWVVREPMSEEPS